MQLKNIVKQNKTDLKRQIMNFCFISYVQPGFKCVGGSI